MVPFWNFEEDSFFVSLPSPSKHHVVNFYARVALPSRLLFEKDFSSFVGRVQYSPPLSTLVP